VRQDAPGGLRLDQREDGLGRSVVSGFPACRLSSISRTLTNKRAPGFQITWCARVEILPCSPGRIQSKTPLQPLPPPRRLPDRAPPRRQRHRIRPHRRRPLPNRCSATFSARDASVLCRRHYFAQARSPRYPARFRCRCASGDCLPIESSKTFVGLTRRATGGAETASSKSSALWKRPR